METAKFALMKAVYRAAKMSAAGMPVSCVCWKTVKKCATDITFGDVPSAACKFALKYCLPPTTGILILGAYGTPEGLAKAKRMTKIFISIPMAAYNIPAKGLDVGLAAFERQVFGEEISIGPDSLFL